ncbi:helicase protein MOM1-like isoform X2 [Rutidosis leptorrhynchoides]|uniref:helicase protein MOM1-like isoform X2 n=1 Tax=Rutidosis leptorrhynchoides TaxID=125765 RepID=UPI003A9A53B9
MFSKMLMSEKREKLKALVNSRLYLKKKKRKHRSLYNVDKNEILGSKYIKRKRLNENVNKKSFKKVGRKLKLKQVVGLIERESGSCSIHNNNTRVVLDSEVICPHNQDSANEPSHIASADDMACETLVEKGKPVEIDYGSKCLCAICMTGEDLLLCPQRGWLCGSCIKKKTESCSCELSELPFEVSSETRNHVLPYINKLRDYWHRGHNAIIFDCQDRLRKVVFFVLSLLDNVKKPILIITATNAISSWEAEFSKWSKLTNFITYKGSNDARARIRSNEFYSENASVKFQVLLSSRDNTVESPKISTHHEKLKLLEADMKLLTITSGITDYQSILSLLDPMFEEIDTDVCRKTNTTCKLKEKLSPFIAFEYKYTHEFKEYWVPVHLSRMQIKQYCSLLDSNIEVLSSCLWDSSPLHDILTQTQKCCDHPYLVDPTSRNSSKKDEAVDTLGAEINVSGKLQLLDKFLLEIERRRLRVLVLYQSVASSEKISTGDILDDLVDRRFGQDFYVRIPEKLVSKSLCKKKKQVLEDFNNLQSTKFICLLDYHSCHSSIRLSNVDVVILFNSNWNPLNDIKAMQRITYDCGPVRVFRLYSAFTLEEKSLIFSKEGTILDVNDYNNNSTLFQQLLAWRVSYLYSKLESETEDSEGSLSFIDNLVGELSCLLREKSDEAGPTSCSNISEAELKDGSYSGSMTLLGETKNKSSSIEYELINDEPMTFWTNLITDNHQKQTNSSNRLSRRVQNSTKNTGFWYEDDEIFSVTIKRKPKSIRKV